MKVSLKDYEIQLANFVGDRRNSESKRMGLKNAYKYDGSNHQADEDSRVGARGELAVAKAMNWYYDGSVNTFKNGYDVYKVQVRTRKEKHYDLLVRSDDRDEDVFVLVIPQNDREFIIHGWQVAKKCKQKEFESKNNSRPVAYFYPQKLLNSMDTINTYLNENFKEQNTVQIEEDNTDPFNLD
jgi:hypothetical protein